MGIRSKRGSMMSMGLVMLAVLAGTSYAGGNDRVFRDGFEPCCSLGGEVTGLAGDGLVLHLQAEGTEENLPIAANAGLPRLYTFAASVAGGTAYVVSIASQPEGQTCSLGNASGTVEDAAIDDIDAACVARPGLIWDQGAWDAAEWQ